MLAECHGQKWLSFFHADIRHDYAQYLMAMGRMAESADDESKLAVELDPVDDELTDCLCWHSFAARRYDDSIQMARNLLARVPDDTWELAFLGWDYEQKGMHEQAIAEFKKAVELTKKNSPLFSSFYPPGLGHAYAVAGRRSDAEMVLQSLLERARRSYVSPFTALIYTARGEKDTFAGGIGGEVRSLGEPLAGKSTLNRLELTPVTARAKARYKKIVADHAAVDRLFVEIFLAAHRQAPPQIILDLEATDDPLHGNQEGRFFHGYCGHYCYLPLYIFCRILAGCAVATVEHRCLG